MMKKSVLAGTLATLASFATWVAVGHEKQPLLDAMQAMVEGDNAVEAKFGRDDSTINGPDFDQTSNEWRMVIERGESTNLHRYLVSINESSGEVCVRELPAADCVARGDASIALQGARDKLQRLADAALNPPPDLQGVMKAVLRHQLDSSGYLVSNRMPLYVAIRDPKGDGMIDLSLESIRVLGGIGFPLMPGSAWQAPSEDIRVGTTMMMGLGTPTRRPDGDYDVTFGFWCGGTCGSQHGAILRHDASGWHVVSSMMNSIS
ncbi:hypothetical protein [Stenotrophomonas sp. Iso1]|uniref:hypothetical protein n=1 Tax=Stenotrophomonas sp. Iso1 TaxID=2977283 RepID=UPI0022B77569|nr:hypothetical protein [Stenotrophomonas sp. Iso1]